MGASILWATALLITIGAFIYWFYGRIKAERDYALRHLVARITAREISSGTLESELKTIICERDEIVADRFDRLIETCPVLDLSGHQTLAAFFKQASETLAESLNIKPDDINEGLITREMESNTAISSDIAIPHLIIDGENRFEILLARCRDGINFSDAAPDVKAVFVLAGTRDDCPDCPRPPIHPTLDSRPQRNGPPRHHPPRPPPAPQLANSLPINALEPSSRTSRGARR